MSRPRSAILLAVAVLVLTACGAPWRAGAGAPRSARVGPEKPEGASVFQARCARCHSATPAGRAGPGLDALFHREQLPNGAPVTEDNVRAWIIRGGGRMPAQRLPDEEMDDLMAYLKTLE